MAGVLERAGWRMTPEPDGAAVVIVNTCGFIGDARSESYDTIAEMLRLKRAGRVGQVVAAGCLAQRDRDALCERFPDLDQVVGVFAREDIAALLAISSSAVAPTLHDGSAPQRFPAPPRCPPLDTGRRRLTLRHLAYLKIAEGCNRLCSFCSIPAMRGPYASKPIDQIAAEAEYLAEDGARELILIAQDTTFYGLDLDGRPRLADLLRRLEAIEKLAWIRLMYLYPAQITDELIETIAASRKIVPYLDIPLQHVNDEVLRRMRRNVGARETEELLDRLRARIDRLVLRTTLMAGFPGETEAQFEELLDFVRRRRFERLGAFAYCKEPGTPAAELDDQLPETVKQARRDRLMAAQREIAFAWNASQVWQAFDVMIDRCIAPEENAYLGRTYADAPEVDGAVYVTGENLVPGEIVPCEIVAASGYDLVGVVASG